VHFSNRSDTPEAVTYSTSEIDLLIIIIINVVIIIVFIIIIIDIIIIVIIITLYTCRALVCRCAAADDKEHDPFSVAHSHHYKYLVAFSSDRLWAIWDLHG